MSVQGIAEAPVSETALDLAPGSEAPETPQTEAPKSEAPPKDDRLAAKFAALTRKDKEIRAREKAYAEKEAALTKRMQELDSRASDKSWQEEMKENPLKFMEKNGITYEQLSEIVLNDQNPTADMKMKRMADQLKSETQKELEALKKQLAEREEQQSAKEKEAMDRQYQQAKESFMTQIAAEVQAKADDYELVHYNGEAAVNLVFEVIEEYYNGTTEKDEDGTILKAGKVLSVEEALKEVEAYYEEQARPITKLKKFQQTSQTPKEPSEGKQTAPTLSNTLSTDVPTNGKKTMSKEEAFREAMKVIRYTND